MSIPDNGGTAPPKELIGQYVAAGWKLLRLHPETKKPVGKDWQRRAGLAREAATAVAERGMPLGVQVGEVSRWLCCVDLDCDEAMKLAPYFLPDTLRAGKSATPSHYVYYSPGLDYAGFRDMDQSELVSLKAAANSQGHQFVVAPSVHPTKGPYQWFGGFDGDRIATVSSVELQEAVRHLAAASLIARHLPDRGRHFYSLALAGYMLRNGLSVKVTQTILRTAWWCKDAPREGLEAVVRNVADTADTLSRGGHATGGKTLEELVPGMPRKLARYFAWQHPDETEEEELETNALLAGRVLLGAGVAGELEPPDELEPGILLKGKVHSIYAGPATGKTMFMLWAVKQCLGRGQAVILLDMENGPRIISERLRALGAEAAQVDNLLHYLPSPNLPLTEEAKTAYREMLDKVRPALVVFDSWINFLASAGMDENSSNDVAGWAVAYTHPARDRGITVLLLDHVPHEGSHARGSTRKKDEVDVMWRLHNTQPFDRDSVGEIVLHREKDREAWLPPSVRFSVGGGSGGFVFRRSAGTIEETTEGVLTERQKQALDALKCFGAKGARYGEWRATSGLKGTTFDRAISALTVRGLVRKVDGKYYPRPDPPGGTTRGGLTSGTTPISNDSSGGKESGLFSGDSPYPHEPPHNPHSENGGSGDHYPRYPHTPKSGGSGGTSGVTPPTPYREFLDDPPDWLVRQLPLCANEPKKYLDPTAAAVATAVAGNDHTEADKATARTELARYIAHTLGRGEK